MSRKPRVDYPGARHHIMNRFLRRESRFNSDEVCSMFTACLADVPERLGARIHGYAIMPNHYHLMVEVPRGNISRVMQQVGLTFTRRYHHAAGLDGPLFRGRFLSKVVDSDAYWQHLLAYLHLNPVRANLARRPEDCVWTSHAAYAGMAERPEWLTTSDLLGAFGSRAALVAYVREVRMKRREAPEGFEPTTLWAGGTECEEVVDRKEVDASDAVDQVVALTRVDPLVRVSRSRPNPSRWLAAWWLHQGAGLPLVEVGRCLSVSGQRAAMLVRECHRHAATDPCLARWMAQLDARRPR